MCYWIFSDQFHPWINIIKCHKNKGTESNADLESRVNEDVILHQEETKVNEDVILHQENSKVNEDVILNPEEPKVNEDVIHNQELELRDTINVI